MTLNSLDDAFASLLIDALPEGTVLPATPDLLEEPRGRYHGAATMVAKPRNTGEVARIVRLCGEHRIGIVPYGGGTGLVGGQTLSEGPAALILSLERMNAIREVRGEDNVLICEAGAILSDIQNAASEADRLFPLTLASQDSCRIGGNLATNAGGVQVLRYGNARDLCLGVEAVMPDGSVLHGLSGLRKDNTGYDLRHLLIGSEGTLGIITAAALKLHPKPRAYATVFAAVESPAQAIRLLGHLQDHMDGAVSAFELMHRQGMDFLAEKLQQVRLPFPDMPAWSVLCEATGGTNSDVPNRMMAALESAAEAGLIEDAVLAQSAAQRDEFWAVRENIPEANRRIGAVSSHDISVPIPSIPDFIPQGIKAIAEIGDFRINCFGHLGDGNLHYNVFPPAGHDRGEYVELRTRIKQTLHDLVHSYGGSVSAEHGIGRLKTADLQKYGDPAKLAAMRAIKTALDPLGIMNPGAVVKPA